MFVDMMESCSVPAVSGYGSPPPALVGVANNVGRGDWRVDMRSKRLAAGQQFSFCSVIELDTRFCLAATVVHDFGIFELIKTLEDALAHHDAPKAIFVGQHTQANLRRLVDWGTGWGVMIRPGTGANTRAPEHGMRMPTGERWSSLSQAKRTISRWRRATHKQNDAWH